MPFIIRMGINAVAILLVAYLAPGLISADSVMAAVAAAFVLGLANALVKPLIVLLTLPVTLLTLGLFLLVVNGFMLWLVSVVVAGFHVHGALGAIVGSVMLSLVGWVLSWFVPGDRQGF
jgi:putative membrane protein